MMTKRDFVGEILERQQRLRFRAALAELGIRFMYLELELMHPEKLSDEMMRYFPIATVASMESFFRLTITELIDDGPPFSDRIDAFDNVRVDLAALKAIHGRRITVGDFMSHLLPLNSLGDINKAMSSLLDIDFGENVRQRYERPEAADSEGLHSVVPTAGELFSGVKDAFRLRHIFSHEFASNEPVDRARIRQAFNASFVFMLVASSVVHDIQSPGAPHTLGEVETALAGQLGEEDQRLRSTIEDMERTLPEQSLEILTSTQESWSDMRHRMATIHGQLKRDRLTSERLAYLQAAVLLTRRRVDELLMLFGGRTKPTETA